VTTSGKRGQWFIRPVLALLLAVASFGAGMIGVAPAMAAGTPWYLPAAASLLAYGEMVGAHGLNPADYELPRLRAALTGSNPEALDLAATRTFALLARDLANGHVPAAQRRLSFLRGGGLTPEATAVLLDKALATNDIPATLDRLAPTAPDYLALKGALAALPPDAVADRAAIRLNMERWRWLPRDGSDRMLLVNIPEFVVRLIDNGQVTAEHRVIVGKTTTPTPQISAMVRGAIINPTWQVPESIIAESIGNLVRTNPAAARAKGYAWTGSGGGLQVRQMPGPNNALGQLKLDMPNALSIYLHDTPSKGLFDKPVRAFSHGCIRTDKVWELAARLLAGTDWTLDAIRQTMAGGVTTLATLPRPVPVHIAYFTVRVGPDGKLRRFDDIYGLDAELAAIIGQ